MRKLGSFLIILLLITAYGRCVADQLGVLHTTNSACCQVSCGVNTHCAEQEPQNEHQNHSEDHPCSNSDQTNEQEEEEEAPQDSFPCQLCFILNSDSMLPGDNLEIPAPSLFEISPFFFSSILDGFLPNAPQITDLNTSFSELPNPPAEPRSRLRRIVAKTTPVRGPSIV